MTLVVDINHWLDDRDLRQRTPFCSREALRIVRLIEYGGHLPQLHGRETLIEYSRPCPPARWW